MLLETWTVSGRRYRNLVFIFCRSFLTSIKGLWPQFAIQVLHFISLWGSDWEIRSTYLFVNTGSESPKQNAPFQIQQWRYRRTPVQLDRRSLWPQRSLQATPKVSHDFCTNYIRINHQQKGLFFETAPHTFTFVFLTSAQNSASEIKPCFAPPLAEGHCGLADFRVYDHPLLALFQKGDVAHQSTSTEAGEWHGGQWSTEKRGQWEIGKFLSVPGVSDIYFKIHIFYQPRSG